MPTIVREGPYRLFFYSNEGQEPAHVHVTRGRGPVAKFWIAPVRLARIGGFRAADVSAVMTVVRRHELTIRRAWRAHFGS